MGRRRRVVGPRLLLLVLVGMAGLMPVALWLLGAWSSHTDKDLSPQLARPSVPAEAPSQILQLQKQLQQHDSETSGARVSVSSLKGPVRVPWLNNCLDMVQGHLALYGCDAGVMEQYGWTLNNDGQLRRIDDCVTLLSAPSHDGSRRYFVQPMPCVPTSPFQRWVYEPMSTRWIGMGRLRSGAVDSLCITAPNLFASTTTDQHFVGASTCRETCLQLWAFDSAQPTKELVRASLPTPMQWSDVPRQGRLLCWIVTSGGDVHHRLALAVQDTWGSRCDLLLFALAGPASSLPGVRNIVTIDIGDLKDDRELLWRKSRIMWSHVIQNYGDDFDWFMSANDDAFVHVDNLRSFLETKDPSLPVYYGRRFVLPDHDTSKTWDGSFYSGGCGVVFSKSAIRILEAAINSPQHLEKLGVAQDTWADDLMMGKVMASLGVRTTEALDEEGRQRFMALHINDERHTRPDADTLPACNGQAAASNQCTDAVQDSDPLDRLNPNGQGKGSWLLEYSKTARFGLECCSKRWIACHYVTPGKTVPVSQQVHANKNQFPLALFMWYIRKVPLLTQTR